MLSVEISIQKTRFTSIKKERNGKEIGRILTEGCCNGMGKSRMRGGGGRSEGEGR